MTVGQTRLMPKARKVARLLVAGSLALQSMAIVLSATAVAQYTSKPLGAPGIDLGPSARPSGQLPASGMIPGTPARPPGEPGAGTYSPVNPLPNPSPRVERLPRMIAPPPTPDYQRTRGSSELTEAQYRKLVKHCRKNPKLTRCKAVLEADEE